MARPPRAWRGSHAGVRGPKDTCPVLLGSASVEGERGRSAVCTVGSCPQGPACFQGRHAGGGNVLDGLLVPADCKEFTEPTAGLPVGEGKTGSGL